MNHFVCKRQAQLAQLYAKASLSASLGLSPFNIAMFDRLSGNDDQQLQSYILGA